MKDEIEQLYSQKQKEYYNSIRRDIISTIPKNANSKLLDIGSGTGNTIHFLKENKLIGEAVGIELTEIKSSYQDSELIDNFIIGNIEKLDIPYEDNYFDIITCADVLEHLVDPWEVVRKLTRKLKPGGQIIVSVPNIKNLIALSPIILFNDFKYNPQGGVLDSTHLRFFAKKNARNLVSQDGIIVEEVIPSFKRLPWGLRRNRSRLLNLLTLGILENYITAQFIIVGTKTKRYDC